MPTTAAAVKDTLQLDYDCISNPSLNTYIQTAAAIIARVVECATRKGITISSTEQELLQRWLTAHLYVMSDQNYKARSTLRASGQFQGDTGMYLEASKYGQTAVLLDPSGCLNAIGTRARASIFWGGKRPSEQVDIDDRD